MRTKKFQVVRYFDGTGWRVIARNYETAPRVYSNITRSSMERLTSLTYSHDTEASIKEDSIDVYIWRRKS